MIELRKDFTKKGGYRYHQVFKNERFAIYECTQEFEEGEPFVFYEIFRMKVKRPDKIIPDFHEAYPSDEEFGSRAWCCSSFESARRVIENDIGEDISEYAKFFGRLGLGALEMHQVDNYKGEKK